MLGRAFSLSREHGTGDNFRTDWVGVFRYTRRRGQYRVIAQCTHTVPPAEQQLPFHSPLAFRGQGWCALSLFPVSCQRMLCPTAPSLPWVAWASLPHFHRYYAPLRLPPPPLGVLRLSLVPRYLACFSRLWSPAGLVAQSKRPGYARAFGHPVPHSGSKTRRQVALPRSCVPPWKTCPALRPRWCPEPSPSRVQDCCLPVTGNRRLSSHDGEISS